MEGCRKGKKFCEFELSLARNQTHTWTFERGKKLHNAKFFPPKDLVYFWPKTRHHSKAQTVFSKDNIFGLFPRSLLKRKMFQPKDLVFFQLSFPFKSAKIFPPKDFVFPPTFFGPFENAKKFSWQNWKQDLVNDCFLVFCCWKTIFLPDFYFESNQLVRKKN